MMLSLGERIRAFRRAHWLFKAMLPFSAAYLSALKILGGLGGEHFILVALLVGFAVWSDGSRRWAKVVFPILLYAGVYDSMRWYADYIRSPVIHIREPYDFDLRFFGIAAGSRVLTPPEWFQLHTHPVLDLITGVAYFVAFFVGESIVLALYLFGQGDQRRALRFVWVFVVTNFLGFSLYYIYPAAPPWYVADHGFALDMTVRASPAGALRFDQMVGLPLMAGFYGKSADVFGAVPSLHVAYPFLAAIYGWHLRRFRWIGVGYFLLVCFAAIYLNHHYLVDILAGLAVSMVAMAAFRLAAGAVEAKGPLPSPEPALAPIPSRQADAQGPAIRSIAPQ